MKWRELDHSQPEDDRPSLAAVLEYYGAHVTRRMTHCVFHEDRTPSMSVDLGRGLWNCHSCGQGGDAWTLIMRKESLDIGGAREFSAAHGLGNETTGGGDKELSSGSTPGRWRHGVPERKRNKRTGGGYSPSWRRK